MGCQTRSNHPRPAVRAAGQRAATTFAGDCARNHCEIDTLLAARYATSGIRTNQDEGLNGPHIFHHCRAARRAVGGARRVRRPRARARRDPRAAGVVADGNALPPAARAGPRPGRGGAARASGPRVPGLLFLVGTAIFFTKRTPAPASAMRWPWASSPSPYLRCCACRAS